VTADDLGLIVADTRAAIVAALRAGGVRAGGLVLSADATFDEAADALDLIANLIGPDAVDAVTVGLDDGMAGALAMGGPSEPTRAQPSYSPPVPDSPGARGPYRDRDAVTAAVAGWAGVRLVAGAGGWVASADLERSWAEHVGRPLTGHYRNVSDAVMDWAAAAGVAVTPRRTERARGLAGLALILADAGRQPAVAETLTPASDVSDDAPAARSWTDRPVQPRPPNGGAWQSWASVEGGAAADTGGWFNV
jgi:hypothetical protein